MKHLFIKLGVSISLALAGWYLVEKEKEYISPETVTQYETLCKNAVETDVLLADEYTETTVKVMKVPVKMYTYKYTYTVNGTTYEGSQTSNVLLTSPHQKVWYDKNTPAKNESSDPCKNFEAMKKKEVSSYKDWFSYIGFPLLLIGIVLGYSAVKNIIRTAIRGNKEAA